MVRVRVLIAIIIFAPSMGYSDCSIFSVGPPLSKGWLSSVNPLDRAWQRYRLMKAESLLRRPLTQTEKGILQKDETRDGWLLRAGFSVDELSTLRGEFLVGPRMPLDWFYRIARRRAAAEGASLGELVEGGVLRFASSLSGLNSSNISPRVLDFIYGYYEFLPPEQFMIVPRIGLPRYVVASRRDDGSIVRRNVSKQTALTIYDLEYARRRLDAAGEFPDAHRVLDKIEEAVNHRGLNLKLLRRWLLFVFQFKEIGSADFTRTLGEFNEVYRLLGTIKEDQVIVISQEYESITNSDALPSFDIKIHDRRKMWWGYRGRPNEVVEVKTLAKPWRKKSDLRNPILDTISKVTRTLHAFEKQFPFLYEFFISRRGLDRFQAKTSLTIQVSVEGRDLLWRKSGVEYSLDLKTGQIDARVKRTGKALRSQDLFVETAKAIESMQNSHLLDRIYITSKQGDLVVTFQQNSEGNWDVRYPQ